jgi:YD repeat-containing protein
MRQLQTYTLNSGNTISGDTMIAWGEGLMVPEPGMYMEAMRFRVDGDKPWGIELYDSKHNLMLQQNEDQDGANWAKNYDGWENWISRTMTSYSATNRLAQDYVFFLRVIYKSSGQVMKSVSIQTKKIK